MREAPPGTGSPEAPRAREKAIYAGGHGEVAIPVPIPNTEVKHLCADDTAESGKVGSCRLFYFKPGTLPWWVCRPRAGALQFISVEDINVLPGFPHPVCSLFFTVVNFLLFT